MHGNIKRVWISRAQDGPSPGWKVAFDFKDGLDTVKGTLWVLEDTNSTLHVTRLFAPDFKEARNWFSMEQLLVETAALEEAEIWP